MDGKFSHIPVMLSECIEALNIKPDGLYVDCTAGGGGHSFEIAKRLDMGGRLISIDRDKEAIKAAGEKLTPYLDRVTLVNDNFSDIENILDGRHPDGVLIDLGVSSYQLDTPERGFSYIHDAPLDMRMDKDSSLSAYNVVNEYPEERLAKIIFEYGEEKMSRRIARRIVLQRSEKPIETTLELAKLIEECVPKDPRNSGSNPAKRTFQAIRIEVNDELAIIEPTIRSIVNVLAPHGRLAVITFHSLEDRAVKQTFAALEKSCTCPKDFPVCVCDGKAKIKVISRKPILPSENELEANRRSHSAKLRVAEKADV